MEKLVAQLAYPDTKAVAGWLVAYSGGLDSRVLLELTALAHRRSDIPVRVIHINHGVNIKANQWAEECVGVARDLALPIEVVSLSGMVYSLNDREVKETGNLEARLRELRYRELAKRLLPDWCLLLAHHADDQAETLLLQLLRGAAVRGMAGMSDKMERWHGGFRWRPLLHLSKQELRDYALKRQWNWIEDDSNQDVRYRRNYIRHKVMPCLIKLVPSAVRNLNRTARLMADGSQLLDEVAQMDWQITQSSRYLIPRVLWPPLNDLSEARRNNLWRYIFNRLGYSMPSLARLQCLQRELVMARPDATPILNWKELTIRRYRDYVYLLPLGADFEQPEKRFCRDGSVVSWQLLFPDGRRCLIEYQLSSGGRAGLLEGFSWRCVPAGEIVRLARDNKHDVVRRWVKFAQNIGVPPWWRSSLPVLLVHEQLTVVPGYWAAKHWHWRWAE